MKKRFLTAVAALFAAFSAQAQVDLDKEFFSLPDSITTSYLDSVEVKVAKPNNYWLMGVYGGASFMMGYFNPTRNTTSHWAGPVAGFSIMRHFTMFGLFHNMGLEFGGQLNYEGYEFKTNPETGARATESGAYKIDMKVPEVFLLSHFHIDMGEYFKIMAKVGLYGGYRLNIERTLEPDLATYDVYREYQYKFHDYDRRLTYGLQGGIGFGVMLAPFEFHVNAQVKWGWESFWRPDYASPYYYRYAYPLDGVVSFGIYYQLSPRHGHTRGQLKKLARKMAMEELENHE